MAVASKSARTLSIAKVALVPKDQPATLALGGFQQILEGLALCGNNER